MTSLEFVKKPLKWAQLTDTTPKKLLRVCGLNRSPWSQLDSPP
jgi:hypothetical protein